MEFSGPLKVRIYLTRLIEATNAMHVNCMMDLLNRNYFKESVHNIIAIADGGSDWSVKGVLNFMSLGFFGSTPN